MKSSSTDPALDGQVDQGNGMGDGVVVIGRVCRQRRPHAAQIQALPAPQHLLDGGVHVALAGAEGIDDVVRF